MQLIVTTMFLVVGVPVNAELAKQDATTKEREKLQGTWIMIGGEEKGKKLTPEEAKREAVEFVIKGQKITWLTHGEIKAEMTFVLDPSRKPATIDLVYLEGKYKGGKNHAIYALDGDELKICVSEKLKPNNPDQRPTDFATKVAENDSDLPGMMLFICKRQKP